MNKSAIAARMSRVQKVVLSQGESSDCDCAFASLNLMAQGRRRATAHKLTSL